MARLVFIHAGTKIPKYLLNNIVLTAKKLPNTTIELYSDHIKNCDVFDIQNVNIFPIIKDKRWKNIEKSISHPMNFRNKYWLHVITRFLVLEQAFINSDEEIIHIESDVIISSDFPVEKFKKLPCNIAFPVVSKKRGIASVLYCRNIMVVKDLIEHALKCTKAKKDTTDMLILGSYYNSGKAKIMPLPTAIPDENFYKNVSSSFLKEMSKSFRILGGIIDGHDIGVYYFGTDPQNFRGISFKHRRIPETFANYDIWKIVINGKREFIDMITQEHKRYPIYSIHMTNKIPRYFNNKQFYAIKKSVNKLSTKENIIILELSPFVKALIASLMRRIRKTFRD